MKILAGEKIPKSNGHYSQAIEHNGILYLSGQLPIDPETRKIPHTIEEQVVQVLRNIERILDSAGSSKKKVLQVRIYISDIALWDQVNDVYSNFFEDHKPVRAIIPVGILHYGCYIEVETIAII